jgi:hypothetical protein
MGDCRIQTLNPAISQFESGNLLFESGNLLFESGNLLV